MAVTLSGSTGTSGSFTLNDSDTSVTVTQPLAATKTVVTAPGVLPTVPGDPGWNIGHIYSTQFHKGNYTGIDASTGVTLTFASLTNGLCATAALSRVQSLTIENTGANPLTVEWTEILNGTTPLLEIPPYAKFKLEVPMNGLSKGASTGIVLKSTTSTTSAYVVIGYN